MNQQLSKKEVVKILEEIGTLLELKGENPFKSRAYFAAARNIDSIEEDLHSMVKDGALSSLRGIGKALNQKITELVTTGKLEYYEKLKASIPPGLMDMLRIPGLGPKKVKILHDELCLETIGELEYACIENRLVDLPGFGRKTQAKILKGIEHLKIYRQRFLYAHIIEDADNLLRSIRQHEQVLSAKLAGSMRRGNETVKDIDIVVSTKNPSELAVFFTSLPQIDEIISQGKTKVSVTLTRGINVDLRMVSEEQFAYALHHFTGSKAHNTAMRSRAKRMGIKINEYGFFGDTGLIHCRNEEEMFRVLGLSFIPPELREDMGEIEAAEKGDMPHLIEYADIRGLFHIHTRESDGSDSLQSLAQAAKAMGFQYIGIADHSQAAFYAGGLTVEEIRSQHRVIDRINAQEKDFHIFKGIEAEILPDGSLDYDDEILRTFDFVIAAVHSHFKMSEQAMTERVLKALDNPFTTMLAHPTGRLLLAREPYRINMKQIIDRAAMNKKIIELNANPHRLDLDWRLLHYAKNQGVKIAINPDAHDIEGLQDIRFGINIARKGWITPSDCINCLDLSKIKKQVSDL
jgi:DNA polymerase (family 10)